MSTIDPRWDELTDQEWEDFAQAWIDELGGSPLPNLPELPILFEDDPETAASAFVVQMNFTASAESQWKFIQAVFLPADERVLGHLAAGPVEHLLSKHGDAYIDIFEELACQNTKFARMLGYCYRHMMTDNVWNRICAVRKHEE